MSIAEPSFYTPTGYHATQTETLDGDGERRWPAWRARGLAHERGVRRRFVVAIVAGAVALAEVNVHGLLSA